MIVVDSSAVIAIMLGEPRSGELSARLQSAPAGTRFISTANYVEAGAVLAGRLANPDEAMVEVDAFVAAAGITLSPFDDRQARIALSARIAFGKGFRTEAKLNLGDSFAYALARSLNAPLLFIGDDFSATDIVSAL